MLTANRIDRAISQVGPPASPEARRELEAEVLRDIRDELKERHGTVLLELGLEDHQLFGPWPPTPSPRLLRNGQRSFR